MAEDKGEEREQRKDVSWLDRIYESLTEHQFKERPGWSKEAPKPKSRWAPRGRTKYSKKGHESKKAAAKTWSFKDPEGVLPKRGLSGRGKRVNISARGARNPHTGEVIKKRR